MKAWGRLVIVVSAALLALAGVPQASANDLHPRHIEFRSPSSRASIYLGERGGYELGLTLVEPDFAVLYAQSFDRETQAAATTLYGAHFKGSPAGGEVRARFGSLGTVAVHFVADGKQRLGRAGKNCEGPRPREERGHFVGRIALRGEGGYFDIATRRSAGSVSRTFQLRCRVKHLGSPPPPISLLEAVGPRVSVSLSGGGGGSLATLAAGEHQGDRLVDVIAQHPEGRGAGADVTALTFEYQGKMPVGRDAFVPESPAGTLVTSLPGEHPATATLKPTAPFTGEATYLASSHLTHSWAGDLAVQFPGLLQPLADPEFFSSLCVVSPLRARYGCAFVPPNWEPAE